MDHAGSTPYARSLIEEFSHELTTNLFGNPHSASPSSQLSSTRVDDVRLRALQFFNADPDVYDLVFVANATAGIKLVADSFRDYSGEGFWFGYHIDSHTSVVGVREVATQGSRCFVDDAEVDEWISGRGTTGITQRTDLKLFGYPAQSNMTGRRLPLRWSGNIRSSRSGHLADTYTLLDAAGLVSTAPLNLGDPLNIPDFVVLSFYKIFGFPDLGALIVRKDAAHILERRKYFGGGTVDMVIVSGNEWHAKKSNTIHDGLEDGTLPFHSVIALDTAFNVHKRLYGSMLNISAHTGFLVNELHERLSSMKHSNGARVAQIYSASSTSYVNPSNQGPIVSFNLRDSQGRWVPKSEVEKLANVRGIHLRSGGLCNPGGTATYLRRNDEEMKLSFVFGQRCGDENDIIGGKPTGSLRVSLGAMSTMKDVMGLIRFLEEFYIDQSLVHPIPIVHETVQPLTKCRFYVESLCVYPIKSCAAFRVPKGMPWQVKEEGLAWDREWCLVHRGTGAALNQKKYPRMALIRPHLDLGHGVMRVTCGSVLSTSENSVEISLAREQYSDLHHSSVNHDSVEKSSNVCGDHVTVQVYSSPAVSTFFSDFLGVPCTLARLPPQTFTRFSKTSGGIQSVSRETSLTSSMPGSFPDSLGHSILTRNPILLSNESPILLISRSSVNRLNESIKANSSLGTKLGVNKAVAADVFRANIIVSENLGNRKSGDAEQPYIEDTWTSLRIESHSSHANVSKDKEALVFNVLGQCQRCQMVSIDQFTANKSEEPFLTLAKTRRRDGKVYFGMHIALNTLSVATTSPDPATANEHHTAVGSVSSDEDASDPPSPSGTATADEPQTIMVGDSVVPEYDC